MRIRTRLLLGFAAVLTIFAVFGAYVSLVWQSVNRDTHTLDALYETTTVRSINELDIVWRMLVAVEDSRHHTFDLLLGNRTARAGIDQAFERYDRLSTELTASLEASEDPARRQMESALAAIEHQHEQLRADLATITPADASSPEAAVAAQWSDRLDGEFDTIEAELTTIKNEIEARNTASKARFDDAIHGVESHVRNLQVIIIVVLALAIAVAFTIGYVTARSISRPIEHLGRAAGEVERGEFDASEIASVTARDDEIGRFARIFERMAEEVRRREQHLRQQIRQLRVEVDRKKSSEQVAEIADTDFFRDLHDKAQKLRADGEL